MSSSITNHHGVTASGSPNMKTILQRTNSPMKNGMGSEFDDLDFTNYYDVASKSNYNEHFSGKAPKSPHKIVRGHKLRRYDDSK